MEKFEMPKWAEIMPPEDAKGPILDIASGHIDRRTQFFEKELYMSFDIDPETKPDIVGDAQYLPLHNDFISTALCLSGLEHIKNPIYVINEIYRVLREGGVAYIYVPFMFFRHDKLDYHRFTEEGIKLLLKDFEIKNTTRSNKGFFSTMILWFLPVTCYFHPFREVIQRLLQIPWIITQKIDIGKDRFYSGTLVEVQKKR